MKRKITLLLAALCALACLAGCQPQSQAAAYLKETDEDEILAYFLNAAYVMTGDQVGFTSPDAIPADDLFRFFVLTCEYAEGYYVAEESLYRIPVADVTALLDSYFDGHQFDPEKMTRYAEYDAQAQTLEALALGFGTGSGSYTLGETTADGDVLQVELVEAGGSTLTITAQVADSGVKFVSSTAG